MSISRRHVLRILGGGLIAAAAGIGTFAATRTPSRAMAPWHDAAHRETDPFKRKEDMERYISGLRKAGLPE